MCQRVDQRLADVLDDREATGHVAVQRAVPDRHLALVAGGQHDRPGLVRYGHQQGAAHPRLDVFLGGVPGPAAELARQHRQQRIERRSDRPLVVAHREPPHHVARVDQADRSRIRRRHHHRPHARRAERVDRQRERQRRIDAAAEAQQHAGKAVLLDVVAQPEGQCAVGLLLEAAELGARAGLRNAVGEVGEVHALDELRRKLHQAPVAVEHERGAVEHQLVLAADQVDERQRHSAARDVGAHHLEAQRVLAEVERRRVENQQHLGAGRPRAFRRIPEPAVFTDIDPECRAGNVEHQRPVVGREVAPLVEHVVVGQVVLAVGPNHHAPVQHRGGVEYLALARQRMADHHAQLGKFQHPRREALQRAVGGLVE